MYFKRTDLCVYCEAGRKLQQEIVSYFKTNLDFNEIFNLSAYKAFLETRESSSENEKMLLKLQTIQDVEFHKQIADRQRAYYNKLRTDPDFLGEDSILIDADWKEKINFGKVSPRQVNNEWYKYGSCSLLGFGVYYTESKVLSNNQVVKWVNCWNFDILSDNTSQKAYYFIK